MTLTFTEAEILDAFTSNGRHPRQAEIDNLTRLGISVSALAGDPDGRELGIRFARINQLADGRFEYAEHQGEPAMTIVARDLVGDVADIIATKRSGYIGAWIGAATMLGAHNVYAPRILDLHLNVYPDALAWLKGNREGVVLVDEERAAAALRDFGPFCAIGGVEHGLHLQALLTPRKPKIVVPTCSGGGRAAA